MTLQKNVRQIATSFYNGTVAHMIIMVEMYYSTKHQTPPNFCTFSLLLWQGSSQTESMPSFVFT